MNKSLDLMKHFKRSTARDFKIDFGVVQKARSLYLYSLQFSSTPHPIYQRY
jgi:hypothetical protein